MSVTPAKPYHARSARTVDGQVSWLVKHWLGCAAVAAMDETCGPMRAEVWKVCAADLMAALAAEGPPLGTAA